MLVSVSSRDREARGRSACLSWTSIFDYPEQLGRTHRRCAPKALGMWKSVLDDIFVPLLLISERKNRDSLHMNGSSPPILQVVKLRPGKEIWFALNDRAVDHNPRLK